MSNNKINNIILNNRILKFEWLHFKFKKIENSKFEWNFGFLWGFKSEHWQPLHLLTPGTYASQIGLENVIEERQQIDDNVLERVESHAYQRRHVSLEVLENIQVLVQFAHVLVQSVRILQAVLWVRCRRCREELVEHGWHIRLVSIQEKVLFLADLSHINTISNS